MGDYGKFLNFTKIQSIQMSFTKKKIRCPMPTHPPKCKHSAINNLLKGTFSQMSLNLEAMDSGQLAVTEQKTGKADTKTVFCFTLLPLATIEFMLWSLLGNSITGVNLVMNDMNIVIL